jgi:hypothetical protein
MEVLAAGSRAVAEPSPSYPPGKDSWKKRIKIKAEKE